MNAYTVTAKGQITLRKELLRHLGVQPGEKISIDTLPGGEIRIRAVRGTGRISDVFGMLTPAEGLSLSIEEMNDVIAKGWAGDL